MENHEKKLIRELHSKLRPELVSFVENANMKGTDNEFANDALEILGRIYGQIDQVSSLSVLTPEIAVLKYANEKARKRNQFMLS